MKKWFIQVGANDGKNQDLIPDGIKNQWNGVLIEPLSFYFKKLESSYSGHRNLFLENIAISILQEYRKMYYIDPDFISKNNLPSWMNDIGSFDIGHIKKHITKDYPILSQGTPCYPLSYIVKKYNIEQLDLLMVDAEGSDFEVIKSLNFNNIKPAQIIYESKHLGKNKEESIEYLKKYGYVTTVFDDGHCNENIKAILTL